MKWEKILYLFLLVFLSISVLPCFQQTHISPPLPQQLPLVLLVTQRLAVLWLTPSPVRETHILNTGQNVVLGGAQLQIHRCVSKVRGEKLSWGNILGVLGKQVGEMPKGRNASALTLEFLLAQKWVFMFSTCGCVLKFQVCLFYNRKEIKSFLSLELKSDSFQNYGSFKTQSQYKWMKPGNWREGRKGLFAS